MMCRLAVGLFPAGSDSNVVHVSQRRLGLVAEDGRARCEGGGVMDGK